MSFKFIKENFIVYFITGLWVCIKHGFLRIFGKIKVSKYPMWIQFDPKGYRITAPKIRKCQGLLKPGDIIARRYENFLDGFFIPGRFSHTGIYVGSNLIVHAMGDGVQYIDVIDFLRCDGFVILRPIERKPEDGVEVQEHLADKAVRIAKSYVGYSYDFDFDIAEDYANKDEVQKRTKNIYCHELTRSCYPDLDIRPIAPKIWNGMIRSSKKQFLAQSFIDSDDFELIYDSDYSEPRCDMK